jgi:drug/metabolite transporter (DMT)-like permease
MQSQKKGNILGVVAILLWPTLGILTVIAGNIPPFELVTISFSVASIIGLIMLWVQKHSFSLLFKVPISAWIIGVMGLFGYHFFYFFALQNAPAVEANLLNYLWPLLIVLLSALLPNERIQWFHLLGAFFGLVGAFLLVSKNGFIELDSQYILGYIFAILAAFTWASYSVVSKKFTDIPTYSVTGFCIVTAILSLICHLSFEQTIIPNMTQFITAVMIGLGPVGGAFYVWDYGMKNGDIKVLGSLSYLIPLLSTFLLIIFSTAQMTTSIAIACVLIICGSIVSSKELLLGMLKNKK